MRIEKLTLKNFRGFEELEIDFPEGEGGLTVFIGVNGSGKTSVLRAISYFFRNFIYSIYSSKEIENPELSTEIIPHLKNFVSELKKGTSNSLNKIDFKIYNTKFQSKLNIKENSSNIQLEPPINRILGERDLDDLVKMGFWSKYGKTKLIEFRNIRKKIRNSPKIFIYYNVDRFIDDEPSLKAKDITKINPTDTFINNFSAKISFDDFFEWFRNTEDYENERRLLESPDIRLKSLNAIRNSLVLFLPKFTEPRVQRQPTEQLVFKDNGHLLAVANLSHGERLTFAIVGDIIRRLSIANPELENPCLGEGIIMIDEIEQHLHPSWQRTIIPNLRKTFPNIQFIITTHSPQVLSNVKRENVFILEDFKLVEKTPHTFGRDSNSILYDLFGVKARPEHSRKEFNQLYRLLDDPDAEELAKSMLNEMEVKYGTEDSEIVRAKLHFEFLMR